MTAGELRRGLTITLSDVARRTGLAQTAVTWIEEQPVRDLDVLILAIYVEGLGGRLEAVVPAPHGTERKVRR